MGGLVSAAEQISIANQVPIETQLPDKKVIHVSVKKMPQFNKVKYTYEKWTLFDHKMDYLRQKLMQERAEETIMNNKVKSTNNDQSNKKDDNNKDSYSTLKKVLQISGLT